MSVASAQLPNSKPPSQTHGDTISQSKKVVDSGQDTYADKKAKALSAKNTVVLSYDELERIKSMCSQTNEQQDYQTMR